MSSTSSSDSESCDCSQCTYSLVNNLNEYGKLMRAPKSSRQVPIYATMAQPLIYYAQVQQPPNRRQANDQPKKENPFKKAFKWYTQERLQSNKDDVNRKIEFADWLDGKYFEYLRESGQQPETPTSHEPRPLNNTGVECQPCPPCPPNKKFTRIKSPWSKRRRPGNDAGDVPEKCTNKSCEFLLKPKDLSRAASDNCYNTPTSGGKSNATVASSNMPCSMKYSARSHSLSDLACVKSMPKHGETVPYTVHEGCRYQEQGRTPPPSVVSTQELVDRIPSNKQYTTKQAKVICQCHQEKVQEAKKVPSKKQSLSNQPSENCKCPQEKVASRGQDPSYQPSPCCKCQQEEIPELMQVPSKELDPTNQTRPCCKCRLEKVSEVKQAPSEERDSKIKRRSSCKCHQQKQQKIEQPPSRKQSHANQRTRCKCPEEELPEAKPKEQNPISQHRPVFCKCRPEKVQSKEQDITNQPKPCRKCHPEIVPKAEQIIMNEQYPTNQPKQPCCKCHLKKVPEVVQVPSQLRTVEGSCQCPQEKVVPVNVETQYEPARPDPPTQNARPCCCNSCKAPIPQPPQQHPPPILCLPHMVQTSTVSSPNTGQVCTTITPSAQNITFKKQLNMKKAISCQCGGKSKLKVDTQRQDREQCVCQIRPAPCPREPGSCQKDTKVTAPCPLNQSQYQQEASVYVCQKDAKVTTPCPNDCHEVSQVFGPIPIRRESYSTIAVNEETGEFSIVKEVAVVSKFTRSVTCVTNDAAQTSDHSIQFEKDGTCCQYPLFFKLIYADVLKNECCN